MHHPDYNYSLIVEWLCEKHHKLWHSFNMAVEPSIQDFGHKHKMLKRPDILVSKSSALLVRPIKNLSKKALGHWRLVQAFNRLQRKKAAAEFEAVNP